MASRGSSAAHICLLRLDIDEHGIFACRDIVALLAREVA
jgi:hypothetical protein